MPIYEYVCRDEKCGEVTEKIRKIKQADDPLPCPECGGDTKRKVSVTSFQLKGGGWEADGYSG